MSSLTFFLLGTISGLLFSIFFAGHSSKKREPDVTQEDIEKITKGIEEIKHLHQNNDLLEAEKEFFNENKID